MQSKFVKRWSVAAAVAVLALAGWTTTTMAEDTKADPAQPAVKPEAPAAMAETPQAEPAGPTIVDVAKSDPQFKTLVKLLGEAGLVAPLSGSRPFTVFAPTDEAFAKLPKEELDALQKPENKAKLQKILRHHIVVGKVTAADVVKLKSAKTLSGEITITVTDGKVTVDKANVTKTDIAASNGVIHVIDAVLIPAEEPAQPGPTAPARP